MLNSIDIDIYLRDEKKCVQQKQNLKFFRSRFFRISSSSSVVLSDCQLLASFFVDEWKQTKKNIFVTKKKVNPNEFEITALLFFNVFVVSCLFIYLFFSLSAVAVFVGWLRREWVWWEKECFCCCWWVSVYFRWIRYNNLQKTEIVESINAGFILMAPTTQPHFHLFFNALSLFCACFHLRPCMCWTEYERTHRERAHDTGIV